MFGFFQSTFTALERGESYSMSVGFKKGRTEAPAGLPFSVMVEFGTASNISNSVYGLHHLSQFICNSDQLMMMSFEFYILLYL